MKRNNCLHHACSEIRASKLSGECTFVQELSRGNLGFIGYVKDCVKRRAILSVKTNPSCTEKAEQFVDEVWESCYHNKAPYE
jgi:mitochondrial inner membrane protease ATP23